MNAFSSYQRRLGQSCLLALAAGLLASGGFAQSIVQANFSSTSALDLNGNAATATTTDGTVLRLVPATSSQDGSVFTLTQRNISGFSTAFQFRLSNAGGISDGTESGADGFVFVLQKSGSGALGASGMGMGYQGIGTSIGIEFDTFQNSDPSTNHLGFDKNGSIASLSTLNVATRFDDGNLWTAWIDYDGTTLEVRANETGIRPGAALFTVNSLSLTGASYLNSSTAYVGFTAATGGAWANHDIVNWTFSDSYISGGVMPGAAIPEPATWAAFAGASLLGFAAWRRRQRRSGL